jgi:hypothetical protein
MNEPHSKLSTNTEEIQRLERHLKAMDADCDQSFEDGQVVRLISGPFLTKKCSTCFREAIRSSGRSRPAVILTSIAEWRKMNG